MGLGIGRAFKKFFSNPLNILFPQIGLTLEVLDNVKDYLFRVPGVPESLKEGKAYRAELKQNLARLGDVRTKGYGAWTDYPDMLCGYTEFVNNEQVYKFFGHISTGPAQVLAIRIGTAALLTFPGQRSEVLLPGETMTLVHPNVYTSKDVETIDLRGSISGYVQLRYRLAFAPATGDAASPTRIVMYGKSLLASVPLGPIQISGTVSNNGTFTVTDRGWTPAGVFTGYSWLEIAEPLTTEGPVDCFLEYGQEDPAAPTIKATNQALVFSDADSSVMAGVDEALADFAVGDVIRAMDTSSNGSTDFTVLAAPDGRQLMLAPPPTDETVAGASLVLVRRRAGPYPVGRKGDKVSRIGFDFTFPALTNNGNSRSVTFEARWQEIDDGDNPLGGWTSVLMTCTNGEFRPFRQSHYIEVDPPARVRVDMRRVTMESNADSIRDAATWTGLRGYVVAKDGEDPRVDQSTRLAVMVRSSGFLSRQQQLTINTDNQALVPVWDADTQTWSAPQATRSPAWATIDWLKSESRGLITDEHINLPAFAAFAADCAERGDTFDAAFDREVILWEGAGSILRVARAQPRRDAATGKITVVRDEETAPTQLFADEINCQLGPVTIKTRTSDSVTGVRVDFVDPTTWTEREGPVAGSPEDPRVVSFFGATRWGQAWAEAAYEWADLLYRVQSFAGEAEMEGLQARRGHRVLVGSAKKGWGHVTTLADVDGLVLTLAAALQDGLNWVAGAQHYVHLQGPDGQPTARINCTRVSEWEILLAAPAGITLRTGSGWRTIILLGHDAYGDTPASGPRVAMVEDMAPNGLRHASLAFRLDDPRVHADPGEPPPDPYAISGDAPGLSVTGLSATWTVGTFGRTRMLALWTAVADAVAYEVQTLVDGAWTLKGTSLAAYFGITTGSADSGTAVRVRAYGPGGNVGPWAQFNRPP